MRKPFHLLIVLSLFFLSPFFSLAQEFGVLPFTGIRYFKEGLNATRIEVSLDGQTWTSNRLPIKTEFKIELKEPTGFKKDAEGRSYPGLEVLILGEKKDTLGYAPNMFGNQAGIGMDEFSLKSLKLNLGFNEKTKAGDKCTLYITFFDLKGKGKLRMIFPVQIVESGIPLEQTSVTTGAQSFTGYEVIATGVTFGKPETYMDSLYFPKSLYHSIRIPEIKSLTPEEGKGGKWQVWIYDEKGEEKLPAKSIGHYVAQTNSQEKDKVNILVTVPLAPQEPNNKKYLVRYRFESADGKKVIDLVNRFTGR
ncbi:MAG: hypothetical protein J0M30_13525 [Chitinophagales bacterium]|nr:hypothetical protein [Chitinophagales bacterium]